MKFRHLKVDYFRCIKHASLEFGNGLNILHGPNELGKSTLVEAMRAALLLLPSATQARTYVTWDSGQDPQVTLDFEAGPEEVWRIEKTFGTTTARLSTSRDGRAFRHKARGRDVDGKIREHLNLGIPAPGGRRAPKGLPDSFLIEVIFPQQDQVTGLLETSLEDDPHESGRLRLTGAFEAMAQDPVFKAILGTVQQRVNEAFTPTGRIKTGAASPFRPLADRIKTAERELQEYQTKVAQGDEVQIRLQELQDDRAELASERDEIAATLRGLDAALELQVQREELEGQLRIGEGIESKIKAELDGLEEARRKVGQYETSVDDATEALRAAQENLSAAREAKEAAVEERRQVEGRADAKGLELEKARLDKEMRTLDDQIQRAERCLDATGAAIALAEIEEDLTEAGAEQGDSEESLRDWRKRRELLKGASVLKSLEETRKRVQDAESALATAEELEDNASNQRDEAEKLENQVLVRKVPDKPVIDSLRQLRRELEHAEAVLNVGISLHLDPMRPLPASITRDGQATNAETLDGPVRFDADREIVVELPDIARLTIAGGAADARDNARAARERWHTGAVPILEAAEVEDLDALEARRAETDRDLQKIIGLRAESDQLAAQAMTLRSTTPELEPLRTRITKLQKSWGEFDQEAVQRLLAEHVTSVDVAAELDNAEQEIDRAGSSVDAAKTRVNEISTQQAAARTRLEELCNGDQDEVRRLRDDPDLIRDEESTKLDGLREERDRLVSEREKLTSKHEEALAEAKSAEEDADNELQQAEGAHRDATKDLNDANDSLTRWKATLEERERDPKTQADLREAMAQTLNLKTQLQGLPPVGERVTQEEIDETKKQLDAIEARVREQEQQILTTRGQLQQIGGEAARERRDAAQDLVQRLKEEEEDLHTDYAGWQKLGEVMVEVEKEQGVHLGRALEGPVGTHLKELTDGRYDGIRFDQHLGAESVVSDGEERGLDDLSIGMRDQISTLFRLAVVAHLQMGVVLDDQLVHSDPIRTRWIRDTLLEHSKTNQVIVFTCRPDDYRLPDGVEGVSPAPRFIDLESVITRS